MGFSPGLSGMWPGYWVASLEHYRNTLDFLSGVQGAFFLRKKTLSFVLSVYSNSEKAIAATDGCPGPSQLGTWETTDPNRPKADQDDWHQSLKNGRRSVPQLRRITLNHERLYAVHRGLIAMSGRRPHGPCSLRQSSSTANREPMHSPVRSFIRSTSRPRKASAIATLRYKSVFTK
jgi:hypothetical protein